MAGAVDFYSGFTKRLNSTKRPTATPVSINCLLKDNTSIVNPQLEIRGSGSSFNPRLYTYCKITEFGRYYYINDWTYENAVWIAHCAVDSLGSFKIPIGQTTKYILRSSYASNLNVVDTFYPPLSWRPNFYYDTASFTLDHYFNGGVYILGIANRSTASQSAVTYYAMSSGEVRRLVHYMLPASTDAWTTDITQMNDMLYKSIYDPYSYIKSCKWFPLSMLDLTVQGVETITFGNYTSNATGYPISNDIQTWGTRSQYVYLPTGWTALEAKYRTNPYAQVFIVVNPWGVIELNPLDFTDSRTIKLYIYPDLVSGNCMLKIYKEVGTTEYFITQRESKLGVDIPLTSAYINASGLVNGLNQLNSSFSINPLEMIGNQLTGIANISQALVPTIKGSTGGSPDNLRTLDGDITLIYTSTYFAQEDNADFGKPLCDSRQISLIPGYVQCQDGHIEIETAYKQEIEEIENFLTGGFFYE